MSNQINIFTDIGVLVNRLRFLLGEAGIQSIIKDHSESGRLAGFGAPSNSVQLFIDEKDEISARTILEDFKKEISE